MEAPLGCDGLVMLNLFQGLMRSDLKELKFFVHFSFFSPQAPEGKERKTEPKRKKHRLDYMLVTSFLNFSLLKK